MEKRKYTPRCSKEGAEQATLFHWAGMYMGKWPELKWMYHIPNGGARSQSEGGRLKKEGVKAGVADICLPVARGGYHGLYIELKRLEGGRRSPEQIEFIEDMGKAGYYACFRNGWQAAAETITKYLEGQL